MQLTPETVAPLVEMIREAGYKAVFDQDSGIIESKMAGLRVGIFYSPRGSLQFYCGMVLRKDGTFGLVETNAANKKYRFAKFYIDSEGDLALEADFPFHIDRAEAPEDLATMLGLWEGSLTLMKEELLKAREEEEAAVPE